MPLMNGWVHSFENCMPRPPGLNALYARPRSLTWNDAARDRKSTRLNSSHGYISYAVFWFEIDGSNVIRNRDCGDNLFLPESRGGSDTLPFILRWHCRDVLDGVDARDFQRLVPRVHVSHRL